MVSLSLAINYLIKPVDWKQLHVVVTTVCRTKLDKKIIKWESGYMRNFPIILGAFFVCFCFCTHVNVFASRHLGRF